MKRLLSLALALLMMLSIVPALAEDDAKPEVTLTAGILYGSHMGDFTKYEIWDYVRERPA